jgi:hypothetical protein
VLGLWLAVLYVIVPLFDQLAPTWREIGRWPIFAAILWGLPVAFSVGIGLYTCVLAGRGTANVVRRWWGEKL